MAVRDLEAFLRQAAVNFDSNLDTSSGSPFDNKVIQPLVRRLGTDPFSIDLSTFLYERLRQAYPKLATDEGDNLTDLLIKPITLLWDPVVRETTRVKRGLSFADPATLTLEEADSLGGNFFIPRRRGRYTRGVARIYFAKPQNVSVNQNNFVKSRGGLIFFPSALQSIRSNEMLLNATGDNLYYFDVNVTAENPGTAYNIDKGEVASIANLNAAVRVTNLIRFRQGEDEEDVTAYVRRLQQSLGEKSMVTLRGIAAKVLDAFPEVNRLNVVGFNDPEMQRDVIVGGGLGPVLASGTAGGVISDTEGKARSRRFSTAEVNFDTLVGVDGGFVLSVVNGTASTEVVQDFDVRGVYDRNTLDVEQQELILGREGLVWMLRKKELTLSRIPGGILFPNTTNGELRVNNGSIHVGGALDIYTRSSEFDEATFTVSSVFDDSPVLSGVLAQENNDTFGVGFLLGDYPPPAEEDVLGVLDQAAYEGWTFQVEDGPNAGAYRVLVVNSSPSGSVVVTAPPPHNIDPVPRRWRLFDQIDIDLIEPKETRVAGDDLVTTQGSDVVTTSGGINFDDFGVAKGDTLRVKTGEAAGDYTILEDPLVPNFDRVRLDRTLPFSTANVDYAIFRGTTSTLQLPLIRVKSIELLDSSAQPQGSFIPYAKPVDIQSRAFQNPARGVKHDFRGASIGLVSARADAVTKLFTVASGSQTLTFYFPTLSPQSRTISIPAGSYTSDMLAAAISVLLEASTGMPGLGSVIDAYHFGIRPSGNGFVALTGGSARLALFGDLNLRTTADIHVAGVVWSALDPIVDLVTGLDTAQVVDGRNVGFYGGPFVTSGTLGGAAVASLMPGASLAAIMSGDGLAYFAPDVDRRVIIGARSLGSVRVFFLEPTTFEVDGDTVFELDRGDAGVLRFIPDPTLSHQVIPPLPGGAVPVDGVTSGGSNSFTSGSQDFLLAGTNPGDSIVIENHPLRGTVALGTEVSNVAGKTFVYTIGGGPRRTVVFVRDDPSLSSDQVTRDGVVEQINASVGSKVASIEGDTLKLFTDYPFTVVSAGTALPHILGNVAGYTPTRAFADGDVSNESPHAGTYDIVSVGTLTLTVDVTFAADPHWGSSISDQTFRVLRSGVQRVSTTQMADNVGDAGLHYFDVELISQGAGDAWNIGSGEQLTVRGYRSDGYYLTTDDENLTFSPSERPRLVISRTILENGVDDDPRNATQVTGQSIQVTYDRSVTVSNVQDFAMSEVERVVCASPLSRHLIPHYIRYDFEYFGGSTEDIVLADHEKYIRNLYPADTLDASDLQKLASDRGATKVTNPLTLIAVVHRVDRSIWVQRSQDSLSTSRLSAFIPDQLNVTRNVTGGATS